MASKNKTNLTRRNFLKSSSLGCLSAGIIGKDIDLLFDEKKDEELPKIKAYRTLGRTGFKVSDISSGATGAEMVLKTLIKSGVNYIDTSEVYSNGNNERMIGQCIKEFDRKSLFITTKVRSGRGFKSKEDIINSARKSLERLQTDYIDCYMIHSAKSSEIIKNEYFHDAMKQLKSEGRIRFCGVSCHGKSWINKPKETMEQVLMTAVEDGRFDVILLVYNFLQQDMGKRILKACKEKDIGTAVMKVNPIFDHSQVEAWFSELERKGKELSRLQKRILYGYKTIAARADSIAKERNFKSNDEIFKDIAIPFVLSNPDVNTVLVALSNFDDMKYHLKLSGKTLKESDKKRLINYKETFGQLYCRHACGICEDKCPYNIPVNTIMRYNYYFLAQKDEKYAMQKYINLREQNAEACKNCEGYCESACPYKVPIQGLLNLAHHNLTLA